MSDIEGTELCKPGLDPWATSAAADASMMPEAGFVAAKVAIWRWTNTSRTSLELDAMVLEPARARWYARLRQDLQEWQDRGGFFQPD